VLHNIGLPVFFLCDQLEYLDLSFTNITDHGAKLLSKCVQNIRILELLNTEITDDGAEFLRNTVKKTNAVRNQKPVSLLSVFLLLVALISGIHSQIYELKTKLFFLI